MFWQYTTNMLHFMGNNKSAGVRTLALLLMAGGINGLPFSQNIQDILTFFLRKYKEHFGGEDPKKSTEDYMRDFFAQLEDAPYIGHVMPSPNTIMNGATSNLFGLWDLSASLSMGRIIPATDMLNSSSDPTTRLVGSAQQMSGALINIPISLYTAAFGDNPDTWKRWEQASPTFVKGISQSIRWATRGNETNSLGVPIKEFDWPTNYDDLLTISGRALGFPSSQVNMIREANWKAYDAQRYYATRHNMLSQMLNYAIQVDDPEKIDTAIGQILQFNADVPFPEMAINPSKLMSGVKRAQKQRVLMQEGLTDQMKNFRLQQEYLDRYSK